MYSLVIPVYKNEASIPELLAALDSLQDDLPEALEVVFVVDGSPDRCYPLLKERLPQAKFASQLLLHSRNYGSFAGMHSGLEAATGEYFAVMAADLQEPPELIRNFFEILRSGEADVVVGTRESREDPLLSRISSRIFWWLYRRLIIRELPEGGVDMFGITRQVRDELLKLDERHSSLIGLLFWLGFTRKTVSYQRRLRKHGRSAWSLHRKLDYLMDSVFAFTDLPIKLLIAGGAVGILFSVIFGLVVLVLRSVSAIQVPGYSAIVITILFFGGLNLFSLGIVGSYVWRAYGNVQRRPVSVVMRKELFRPHEPGPLGGRKSP